jgi:hypothetical protein
MNHIARFVLTVVFVHWLSGTKVGELTHVNTIWFHQQAHTAKAETAGQIAIVDGSDVCPSASHRRTDHACVNAVLSALPLTKTRGTLLDLDLCPEIGGTWSNSDTQLLTTLKRQHAYVAVDRCIGPDRSKWLVDDHYSDLAVLVHSERPKDPTL